MIRLHSYLIYLPVFIVPVGAISLPIFVLTNYPNIPWYTALFFLPVFAIWGYILYHQKRVYYKGGQLYIGNLFSKDLSVIRKDRFGSVDRAYDIGTYKITYYDGDNNVKYAYFQLNYFLSDGKEIIDKLNEINE